MDILNKRYKVSIKERKTNEQTDGEIQRYLFLDIDGVLNTTGYSGYLLDHDADDTDEDGAIFDPEAIKNLECIIKNVPDLKLIISSTWRFKGWEWMNRLWKKRKLPGEIYSFTPGLEVVCYSDLLNNKNSKSVYPYGTRALEINEWLRLNARRNPLSNKYVIIDDYNDFLAMQLDHVIITDSYFGITKEDVVRALEMLL